MALAHWLIKWTDKTLNNIHSPVLYFLMNHENHYKLHVTHFIHFVIIEITYVKKKYIYNLQVAMAIRGRLCIIDLLLQARFTNHFMLITSCKCWYKILYKIVYTNWSQWKKLLLHVNVLAFLFKSWIGWVMGWVINTLGSLQSCANITLE